MFLPVFDIFFEKLGQEFFFPHINVSGVSKMMTLMRWIKWGTNLLTNPNKISTVRIAPKVIRTFFIIIINSLLIAQRAIHIVHTSISFLSSSKWLQPVPSTISSGAVTHSSKWLLWWMFILSYVLLLCSCVVRMRQWAINQKRLGKFCLFGDDVVVRWTVSWWTRRKFWGVRKHEESITKNVNSPCAGRSRSTQT